MMTQYVDDTSLTVKTTLFEYNTLGAIIHVLITNAIFIIINETLYIILKSWALNMSLWCVIIFIYYLYDF